ncbi:hypothetical protein [Mesorhizobium sp. AR10]|nr:hypothetical protein [Mesorhizobium sp. AR10]
MTDRFCDDLHVFIGGSYRHHLATPFAEMPEPAVERAVLKEMGR